MKRTAVLLGTLALLSMAAAPAGAADARYALAHRCVDLRSDALGKTVANSLRLQPSDLGQYLLYGKDGTFLTATAGGGVAPVATPSAGTVWRADADGRLSIGSSPAHFSVTSAEGCATYPESDTDVTGEPTRGAGPYAQTHGLLESHLHWMAFELFGGNAHCGRPWSPYGVAFAMVDCPDHQPGGFGLLFENVLSGKSPTATHDRVGWPTFKDWPAPTSLTHEGTYYKWVERAWRGGLRLMVNLFVDSSGLCNLQPTKSHNCNEMDTVRLEIKQLEKLQDYVDAQFGGPGKGWLRIVRDPFEARRVINDGKLAVVMGVEISRLFDCRINNGVSECTRESVRRDLDAMRALGVRSFEIAVKTDSALSGAAGDPGFNGVVTNVSNRLETGHFFDMRTCTGDPRAADKTQVTLPAGFAGPVADLIHVLDPGGATPVYPDPPHCNTVGLSPIGRDLITQMMDKGVLIDPDHMSQAARQSALDLVEARRYSGVISSHSWSTPLDEPRILKLGGLVIPKAAAIAQASPPSWMLGEYARLKALADPRYGFGFGFGSDMNGVAKQPVSDGGTPVTYPFRSLDGKQTIQQATTGARTWDYNKDGVAQYGLYLDWLELLRRRAGPAFATDMLNGSESYLQMWERAVGVPARRPLPARTRFTSRGLGKVRLGLSPEAQLRSAGQPAVRGARSWRWSVTARDRRPAGRVSAVLAADGRTVLVSSTAPEHVAGGVGPGARVSAAWLRSTRRFGASAHVRNAGRGARYVYELRGRRVTRVSVVRVAASRTPAQLRRLLRLR